MEIALQKHLASLFKQADQLSVGSSVEQRKHSMKRGLLFTIQVMVLTLVGLFFGSGILMAQTDSQDELRQSVSGAAKEIENGNIELAKQLLNEISVQESTPDDVAELIARLRTTIENRESTQNQQSSEQSISTGMTREELQEYLKELSDAVRVLFDPEKTQ